MRSPIKTIIKNKTANYYRNRLASNVALNLAPEGQPGDSAEFFGDVFTSIDRLSASELLMGSVLAGNIEIEYVVDNVVSVSKNTDKPNYRGNSSILDAISAANGYTPLTVATVTTEPESAPAEVTPSTTKTEDKPAEPVAATNAAENEAPVKPGGPEQGDKEADKKPEASVEVTPAAAKTEDKPKRQRRIKVD